MCNVYKSTSMRTYHLNMYLENYTYSKNGSENCNRPHGFRHVHEVSDVSRDVYVLHCCITFQFITKRCL